MRILVGIILSAIIYVFGYFGDNKITMYSGGILIFVFSVAYRLRVLLGMEEEKTKRRA